MGDPELIEIDVKKSVTLVLDGNGVFRTLPDGGGCSRETWCIDEALSVFETIARSEFEEVER